MQETRQLILEILRERGEATVDEIVAELRNRRGAITPVTVRHHLTRLQEEKLLTPPQLRHRGAPGRPQHVYALADAAREYFPNNYQSLAIHLINQLSANLPPQQVNVVLEGVAQGLAADADIPDIPLPQRLDMVVEYLNRNGYQARWDKHPEGFLLETTNCPYHHISEATQSLCEMDMRLMSALLGVVPRLWSRMSQGGHSCAYLIPANVEA